MACFDNHDGLRIGEPWGRHVAPVRTGVLGELDEMIAGARPDHTRAYCRRRQGGNRRIAQRVRVTLGIGGRFHKAREIGAHSIPSQAGIARTQHILRSEVQRRRVLRREHQRCHLRRAIGVAFLKNRGHHARVAVVADDRAVPALAVHKVRMRRVGRDVGILEAADRGPVRGAN